MVALSYFLDFPRKLVSNRLGCLLLRYRKLLSLDLMRHYR